MTQEQIIKAGREYLYEKFEPTGVITEDRMKCFVAGAYSCVEEIEHLKRVAAIYKKDAQDTAAECKRLHDIIARQGRIIERLKQEVKQD